MNIDKAIRLLEALRFSTALQPLPLYAEAVRLGIEALKRCRVLAQESKLGALQPLPGETKE